MSVFSRVADIVNSNINAMLDKAQDPSKMIRLIIQEMEQTLVEVRTSAARGIADRKELLRKKEHYERDVNEWNRKAEVAVRKQRDDLAKAALVECHKSSEILETIDKELVAVADMLDKMNEDIATLTQKLKDAKARQSALLVRGKSAQARLNVRRQLSERNVDEAIVRFEQYERKIDDLEGEVESYDMGQKTLADEIDDLETDEKLDEELSELKRKVAEKSNG
ncbi:MAG: phage shock protein PspA [Gammaproteobacteria bacterium]|nr:phage shock protein PspA [Gammaproteobacteria bacterium]